MNRGERPSHGFSPDGSRAHEAGSNCDRLRESYREPARTSERLNEQQRACRDRSTPRSLVCTGGPDGGVCHEHRRPRQPTQHPRPITRGLVRHDGLCGLARSYGELLLARFAVGIGEAGGTPPSTSILADKFPPAARPMALTIFALGACLGSWLGTSVAGAAAERGGWRLAFLVLGIPGLILALLVAVTVREPRRGQLDTHGAAGGPDARRVTLFDILWQLLDTARFMLRQRSAVHLIIGGSIATFWSWGLMWWTPTFLQRSHALSVGEAGGLLGPMHLVAGTAGTLLAGAVMGLPAARDPRFVTRFLTWLTLLSTVPSFLAYEVASLRAATVLLWIFVPAVYFYIGPILGLLQNVMPANMRAGAVAILLFTANVANLILAPQLIGLLSDWFAGSFGAGRESLRWALLLLATTGVWAAWHLWVAGKSIRADEARAT
ncbi:MAG TPA: MFS transporter [Steroidobacteraceae bacterium]|nr:MFS transporter [Steroidobacteraceae bacterium]